MLDPIRRMWRVEDGLRGCSPELRGPGALAILLVAVLCVSCQGSAPVVQPIQFSHRAHTGNGMPCAVCHAGVEQAASATLPDLETCLMCHRGAITQSPEEEKIRQLAEAGGALMWGRLYGLPTHVYFSHRRHVVSGGVECARCHGDIADAAAPPPRPAVLHTMATCMGCHAERQVTNDCIRCHR